MLEVRIDFRDFYVSANKAVKTVSRVDEGRGGGGGEDAGEDRRGKERRVTFQCQLYNAFYYAGALLWGNTAMKKEEDVETSGSGKKGQKKKEIALPGFHIESLRSSGTFTPSPLPFLVTGFLPPIRPSNPPAVRDVF